MQKFIALLCCAVGFVLPLPASIVINEIHYNPDVKTEPVEFVELYNAGVTPVNLAGWRFSDGLAFIFPSTNVAPGGFVVVAQNPATLLSKFGVTGALGPFKPDGSSELSSTGERLVLRDAANNVVDEVDYQLGFPWPTVGDPPGFSIELIHPSLDNNLGGSWRASTATAVGQTSGVLIPTNAVWRYAKGTNEASSPAAAWRAPAFNDAGWLTGAVPIGYDPAVVPTGTTTGTRLDDMAAGGYLSVFLRRSFVVSDPGSVSQLQLEALFDDGIKVWINGTNVLNQNISTAEVPYNGTATSATEDNTYRTFNLNSPGVYLLPGTNVIAVQVHNSGTNSSDCFFDARLTALSGPTGSGPTPGRINAVFATNAPPQIRQVEHAPNQPRGGDTVLITAKVTDPDGVGSVQLQYQIVSPGSYIELTSTSYTNLANWVSLPMNDGGTAGDVAAGDDVFTAQMPASVQVHRRLIRYRISVTDTGGRSVRVPYADDPQPNFAYFVYDGVPAWTGAVQPGGGGSNGVVRSISSNEMARLPAIHLIGTSNAVATATWHSRYGGDAYQWQGTLVYDGKVLDHIRYRARAAGCGAIPW